jgi:hypothetical protein
LMKKLGLSESELIPGGYIDLIEPKETVF